MKAFLWLVACLLLGMDCVQADEKSVATLVKAWQDDDDKVIGSYNESIYEGISAVDAEAILKEIIRRWSKEKPNDGNYAEVVRMFTGQQLIANQQIIPLLIRGMEKGDWWTGMDSFYALTDMTRLYDGPLTPFPSAPGKDLDKGDRTKIAGWFQDWWEKNKTKDVILTKARQAQIKARFIAVCQEIEGTVKDEDHSLHGFKAPDDKIHHSVGEPLFEAGYDGPPRFSSQYLGQRPEKYGKGWLWVIVRDPTPLIKGIYGWSKLYDPMEGLPMEARKIHEEPLGNTPWIIEVYVKDTTAQEDAALQKKLEEGKPEDLDKAIHL